MQRAAGGAHAGPGGGAHAGLGDSQACELERLLYLALLPPPPRCANSHTGTRAGGGREGVKVPVGKPDADLSVWLGAAARPKLNLIKPEDNAMGADDVTSMDIFTHFNKISHFFLHLL